MGSELRTQNSEPRTNLDPRLAKLLADAEGRWGRGALVRLGDALQPEVEVIPTGFLALDEALGIGGLPCGRISEIFGPDSSGKQALAAHLVVQCQRSEGVAAYVDLGRRLDPEQMRAQGVDFQSLLVARPDGHLQGLEMAIRLARSGGIQLMILDLQRTWDGETGRRGDEESARPLSLITHHSSLSLALRRLVSAVDRNGIAFVFLTEAAPTWTEGAAGDKPLPYVPTQPSALRPRPYAQAQHSALSTQHRAGGTPALPAALCPLHSTLRAQDSALCAQSSVLSPQSSKGGQALRFFASVRLGIERREWIRRGRDVMGCRSLIQVAKNKLAPPLREAEVDLLFYRFPPTAPALQLCRPGLEVAGVPLPGEARYARA